MKADKKIAIGSDHGGFEMKEFLKKFLIESGHSVIDCGTNSKDSVDYPKFAHAVASKVSDGTADFGIVVDGAGIGSAMVANKIPGVRAALCYDISTARNAREHNDANVLTLGAGLIGFDLAKQILEIFLSYRCIVDRHLRRVQMIKYFDKHLENENKTEEEELIDISNEDLARVAEKIKIMMKQDSPKNDEHCDSDIICQCGICFEKKPETIRKFIDFGVERIGIHNGTGCECVPEDIAKCIDHTLLKPDATENDIKRICAEAKEYKFAAVCISPSYVKLAAQELAGTLVKVCTVVGFPSGAHRPEIKVLETRQAIRDGAKEIDMVINIGALKSGDDDLVFRDIRAVREACVDGNAVCKVIIEAAYLNDNEKERVIKLTKKARADYVKTSTGFGPHGATVDDVALMSKIVGQVGIGVKAAGGIKSLQDVKEMVSAGATRIGASAGIKIIKEAKAVTLSN